LPYMHLVTLSDPVGAVVDCSDIK